MKNVKKTLRKVFFILFVIIAAFGAGISGCLMYNGSKDRFWEQEVKVEQVEDQKDD